MTADRPTTEPRTEAACPKCDHDVDHTTACPGGCPKCASPRQRFIDNVLMGGVTTDDREWLNRALDEIVEVEAAPRAEGLDVERLRDLFGWTTQYGWCIEQCASVRYPGSHIDPPDPCTCGGDRITNVALRLSRPSDERVPESEEWCKRFRHDEHCEH